MLTDYLHAAMSQAQYEILPDDSSYYGQITACQGVYANAATLEQCRVELQQTLEDWVLFRIYQHLSLPDIAGIKLTVKKETAA
ncbi:MAG TPA: type II toxin-antitoxin system HicB family antitoxin [Phycisphaerales bacterium]|nr:type II toxin-antitoxin system HicB family antitoxin [Phycisphaerales bacterium]